ncbi:Flavin-binding monooxygenase-like protein [Dictyocaulus viviparus]|uniref:Flavin-containing monooxygenase n=1 Tax=Dictyocaulus viviparus TaxID=29172 RepID=A0A0D8XCV4_DICVI|nr:Flavin-binding monooxygenase-like protein [Dictyocaulus viviparus]
MTFLYRYAFSFQSMRIAVIGAGASGLPAIKSALEYDCEVVCFEMSDNIGGLWRYKPNASPGEGTVMKTTVINTSKEMTAYSDFPPPNDAANFMHNTELLQYFHSYAKHFDLTKHIRFLHKVKSIRRNERFAENGQWDVEWIELKTNKSASETFDGVMVCTGHHTDPYWPPPFPGQKSFKGKLIHSHNYSDHKGYEDQTVVVIGIGNSGVDIAVELSKISKKVYLATRSGSWIMNRVWDGGEPADLAFLSRFMFSLRKITPWCIQNYILERKLNKRFDHGRFGLKPKHHVLSAHVTINDELPNRIISGTLVIKPNIKSLTNDGVIFEDGTEVSKVDSVIFATGFSFGFPLVEDGELIPVKENQVDLYKYMYPPQLSPKNSLAVIGLIQPTGSIMPISEMQTRVFVAALKGDIKLPSKEKMEKDIKHKHKLITKEFIASRRHTIQVYYVEIMDELAGLLGCRPNVFLRFIYDPLLAKALFFHGLVPYQYRLQGPHSWHGAREAILTCEDRVFNTTRTRKTEETLCSKPQMKITTILRLLE